MCVGKARVLLRGSVWAGPGKGSETIFEFLYVPLEDNDVDFFGVDESLDVLLEFDRVADRHFDGSVLGDGALDARIDRDRFERWARRNNNRARNWRCDNIDGSAGIKT